MKVSFVIPAYNEESSIGQCLQSVFNEIERVRKSGEPFEVEVVVVDNASTDQTREAALKFPNVTVVHERIKGLVYARRAGFMATDGDIVANIDADTMLPKGWLSTVLSEFKNPDLVALSGPYIYHDIAHWKRVLVRFFYAIGYVMHLINHHVLKAGAMLQGGNFVLRRDAWERAGGFDVTFAFYGEDTDVAKRIGKQGRVKWTWAFPMYTSGRRLEKEGLVRMSLLYTLNHLWVLWSGKPATKHYTDIRPE